MQSTSTPPAVATSICRDRLDRCLREINRPDEAVKYLRRALAIAEAILGRSDVHVAAILHTLAASIQDTGRPEEAEGLLVRTLEIEQAKLGPHGIQVVVKAMHRSRGA